jgi:hypothetical protein
VSAERPRATEEQIDRIGDLVGMAPGGWDMVPPEDLIDAVLGVMAPAAVKDSLTTHPDLVRYLAGLVRVGHLSRGQFALWVGCDRCDVDEVAAAAGVVLP